MTQSTISAGLRSARFFLRRQPRLKRIAERLSLNRLARSWYEKTILHGGVHRVELLGQRLQFVVRGRQEITRIDSFDGEQPFVRRMAGAVRPGDRFFDVGANIGVISLLMASLGEAADLHVHAFEPEPRHSGQLEKNVALNGLTERIVIHQCALGDRSGPVTLFAEPELGDGRHSLIDRHGEDGDCATLDVPMQTLDGLAAETGIAPEVVKIDVEGAELAVLHGMDRLLAEGAVRELFLEIHPHELARAGASVEQVHEFLAVRGYGLVWSRRRVRQIHAHFAAGLRGTDEFDAASEDSGKHATR